ncbi:hypothetical protein D3C78_1633830 [compost metagenome]
MRFVCFQPVIAKASGDDLVLAEYEIGIAAPFSILALLWGDLAEQLLEALPVEEVQANALVVADPAIGQQPLQLLLANTPLKATFLRMLGELHGSTSRQYRGFEVATAFEPAQGFMGIDDGAGAFFACV